MAIALSLLVLASIALLAGGCVLLRRGMKRQGWLMLGLAVVMAINVAIWTLPTPSGDTLANEAPHR